jgi:hypothetical protein
VSNDAAASPGALIEAAWLLDQIRTALVAEWPDGEWAVAATWLDKELHMQLTGYEATVEIKPVCSIVDVFDAAEKLATRG